MLDTLVRKVAEAARDRMELDLASFKNENLVQHLSAGIEDSIESDSDIYKVVTGIESTLQELVGIEDSSEVKEELGYAQIKSASYITPLVSNPVDAIKRLYGSSRALDEAEEGTEDLGTVAYRYGIDDKIEVGMEYFDMQNVSTSLIFNIVYNAFAPKQDEFAELFFPLVAIDPMKAGIRISTRLINIYKEFTHTVDGTPGIKKIQEQPLIKAVTDTKLLTADKVELKPVYRADKNSDKFFDLVKWNEEYMDTTITTAPIKFGTRVSLVGLAQTDEMLAKGGADFTDGLNDAIRLKEIYVRMTGKDADGNDVTETFKFSLRQRNSWFNETLTGTNKQMVLNFDEDNFIMLTPDTKAIDANGNEVDSVIMANLPSNLKINLRIDLTGKANVALGDVQVFLNKVDLENLTTKEGVPVDPASDDYAAVKAVIDSTQPGGYVIEAYAYLGNAKRKGIHVLTRKQSVIVTVPYRSGFTQVLPTVVMGDDGDPTDLIGQIMGTRMKLNAYAIVTISEFINDMRANPDQTIQGLSQFLVNNYFREETINIADLVDTMRSTERI